MTITPTPAMALKFKVVVDREGRRRVVALERLAKLLMPKEVDVIRANQQRCGSCGHLKILHLTREPTPYCMVDGCNCSQFF